MGIVGRSPSPGARSRGACRSRRRGSTIAEKSSLPIEIAAPSTKLTTLSVYLPTSFSRICLTQRWPRPLDLDRAEPVRVQPVLEPIDVAVGVGLAGPSIGLRKVGVEPVCGRLRLIDDDGGESPDAHDQRRREAQVHDGDREAAPDPEPPDPDRPDRLDERVEQQGQQARDQEQEDDVKDTSRNDPRQDQQQRKPDQLDPARDLDLRRRAGGHRGHRTARVVRPRSGVWDWAPGAGGLARSGPPAPRPGKQLWGLRTLGPVRSRIPGNRRYMAG